MVKTETTQIAQGDIRRGSRGIFGRTTLDESFYKLRSSVFEAVKRSPENKTYTVIVVTLITIIFFVFATIIPTLKTIATINSEIKQRKNIAAQISEKVATVEKLAKLNNDKAAEMASLNEALPWAPEQDLFLANAAEIARKNNLTFVSSQFSEDYEDKIDTLPSEFRAINTSFTVRGKLPNFIKFVDDLENYPRIFNIESINVNESEDAGSQDINFSLRGRIYIVKTVSQWDEINSRNVE